MAVPATTPGVFPPTFKSPDAPLHQPGIHALIVGVSRYPYLPLASDDLLEARDETYTLGLSQLTSAATSGFLMHEWLLDHGTTLTLPLLTCRTLLAPSEQEVAAVADSPFDFGDAELQTFLAAAKAWRQELTSNPESIGFFYFAGHGFQRKRDDHVLLLQGQGREEGGRLSQAIEVSRLISGMAPSEERPDIALRQIYFFDACRLPLTDGYKYEDDPVADIWPVPKIGSDDRIVVEFYTTKPGMASYAIQDSQTVFNRALIRCLNGSAAAMDASSRKWLVTADSLTQGLREELGRMADVGEGTDLQRFEVRGLGDPFVLVRLREPPLVDLTLQVKPDDIARVLELNVDDLRGLQQTFGPPLAPHPYHVSLAAGNYLVKAAGVLPGRTEIMELSPISRKWLLSFDA